jgi:hypothetical protein
MLTSRKALLVLLLAASWPVPGYSQANDCEAVKSPAVPYQITVETSEMIGKVPAKSTSTYQVYRDASAGTATVHDAGGSLSIGRMSGQTDSRYQRVNAGIFMLENHGPLGFMKYEYSGVDPKKFDYESKGIRYKTRAATVEYNFIERTVTQAGPCRLNTIRFTEQYTWNNPHTANYTITKDYSPELQYVVAFRRDLVQKNGEVTEFSLRTTDLTTKFRPVR